MGSLAGLLVEAGLDARQFDLFESVSSDLPWTEAAGLILLGGSMSANDGERFPFLVAELDWIRTAVHRQVPMLGICLGAQLLAKALGAAVYRNAQREIGWYQVDLLPAAADDRLFRNRSAQETVFHWHGDTFDLPAGAVHLRKALAAGIRPFVTAIWPMVCSFTWRCNPICWNSGCGSRKPAKHPATAVFPIRRPLGQRRPRLFRQ